MGRSDVSAAFEILLKEIELVRDAVDDAAAEAARQGDYEKAREAIAEAEWLVQFRDKVKELQKQWTGFATKGLKTKPRKAKRRTKSPLPRGLRTPEDAFRRPILEALVELGGSAPIGEVLVRVERKMSDRLNSYDMEPLPSDPHSVRWKNTAQWCRQTLVYEGC